MPGSQHGPSIKNPRVYEALRRKGMSKQRAARISNAMVSKDAGAVGLAIPPHGNNALFNQPGIVRSSRRRKRLKAGNPNYGARAGQTIIGNLGRGNDGRFVGAGGQSSSAPRSKHTEARRQRAAERTAAREAERAAEEAKRAEEDAYIAAGATGRERQKRRAEIAAARRERATARREARVREAEEERTTRAQEDAEEAEAPKAGGGGGGKKPKPKPTDDEKKAEQDKKRVENRTKTAPSAGLSTAEAEFLASAASGTLPPGSFDAAHLMALGLVADAGDTTEATDAGRRALNALERGDVRGALAAIQDGKARVARDEAKRKRDEDKQKPRDDPRSRRADEGGRKPDPRRSPGQLPPGRPTPSPVDVAAERERNRVLAGQAIRNLERRRAQRARSRNRGVGGITNIERQNEAQRRRKEQTTYGGTKRDKLADQVFAGPDRSFPIVTAQDVRDAVRSLGRTKHDKAAVRRGIIRRARAIGAVDALPAIWKVEKAYTPTRTTSAGHTGVMVALYPDAAAAQAIAGADGATEPQEHLHLTLCFLGDSAEQPLATNKERVIDAVAQWAAEKGQALTGVVNGLGRFFHSEKDGTNAVYVAPDVSGLPELRQSLAEWIEASGFDYSHDHGFTPHITVAYVPEAAPTPPIRVETPIRFDHVTLAWGDEHYELPLGYPDQSQFAGYTMEDWDDTKPDSFYHAKAFSVFKDSAGRDRWLAITTTAYEDKDQEWITCKAIRGVVAAGDSGAPRGPLRFWHVSGLDLGDCDYQASAFGDRVLIESGTFRSKAAARIGQEAARRGYEMSPGFLHTRREPHFGAFDHIALFERSFVPPGRASNPYTRLLTKEARVLTKEKRDEFARLAAEPESRALLEQLLAQADATVKENDATGAVYKDAPSWAQALIARLDTLEATVKAPMPPAEMVEASETEVDDGLGDLEAEVADDGLGDAAGDMMDDDGFAQLIVDKLLAALGPMLDLEKKMSQWAGEIKAAIPTAVAQKDDARAAELAALQAANTTLDARIKELEGSAPRQVRQSLAAQTWDDLTGQTVTKEQAAALTAKPPATAAPSGLSDQEQGAYELIFGTQQ